MKTFVLLAFWLALVLVILDDVVKCFSIASSSADKALPRIWPNTKYIFPYSIQSPVNITLTNAQRRELSALRVYFPWQSAKEMIRIENTGYFLEVLLPHEVEERPYITGGPLFQDKYIFDQFHFHWGKTDLCGSEHLLAGKCFPTEIHVVFYNEIYGSLEEAVNHADGVTVVAFFGEHKPKNVDNSQLKDLIAKIPKIIQPGSSTSSSFKIEFLFIRDTFRQQLTYFAYPGSLTTPAFSECVTWIICPQPFSISTRQVDAFRTLRATDGSPLRANVRALQDFNGRPLITPSQERNSIILL